MIRKSGKGKRCRSSKRSLDFQCTGNGQGQCSSYNLKLWLCERNIEPVSGAVVAHDLVLRQLASGHQQPSADHHLIITPGEDGIELYFLNCTSTHAEYRSNWFHTDRGYWTHCGLVSPSKLYGIIDLGHHCSIRWLITWLWSLQCISYGVTAVLQWAIKVMSCCLFGANPLHVAILISCQ